MKIENNIPAYPIPIEKQLGFNPDTEGLTILDYFAGQALPYCQSQIDARNNPDNAAHHAYRYAAAMLEARQQYL